MFSRIYAEAIANNVERLSAVARDEREATRIAEITGRYVTLADGTISHNRRFIKDYVEMCKNH